MQINKCLYIFGLLSIKASFFVISLPLCTFWSFYSFVQRLGFELCYVVAPAKVKMFMTQNGLLGLGP